MFSTISQIDFLRNLTAHDRYSRKKEKSIVLFKLKQLFLKTKRIIMIDGNILSNDSVDFVLCTLTFMCTAKGFKELNSVFENHKQAEYILHYGYVFSNYFPFSDTEIINLKTAKKLTVTIRAKDAKGLHSCLSSISNAVSRFDKL